MYQEQQRPLHVPEVVLEYQKSNEPMIKHDLCVNQLTRELSEDVIGAEVLDSMAEIISPTTQVDKVGVTEKI